MQWYGGPSLGRREENDPTGASPFSNVVVERSTLDLEESNSRSYVTQYY